MQILSSDRAGLARRLRGPTVRVSFSTAAIAVMLSSTGPAWCNQGPAIGGPIGATDINNALLPSQPGVFVGLTGVEGWSTRLADDRGDLHPGSSALTNLAGYVGYEYPFTLFGGRLESGVQGGYEAIGHLSVPHLGKAVQTGEGWRDLYVDFFNYSYHVGPLFGEGPTSPADMGALPLGLTVKAEYSMIFPVGHYNARESATSGSGTTFYIPNAAITYFTKPDLLHGPLEFDLHAFIDIRAENPSNHYHNGKIMALDFAIAQRIHAFAIGIAGSYDTQLDDDTELLDGVRRISPPCGNHLEILQLGPILGAPIMPLNAYIKIKAPIGLAARNTLKVNSVVANLYIPIP